MEKARKIIQEKIEAEELKELEYEDDDREDAAESAKSAKEKAMSGDSWDTPGAVIETKMSAGT